MTKREYDRLGKLAADIKFAEKKIDTSEKVYLFSWIPDPKKMPDCDFNNQHLYMAPYVQSYLQGCASGAACVETTQLGNPHYHGWYQVSDNYAVEQARIRWVKVLQKIGLVKITKARYIKRNRWYKKGNALFYYKEDSAEGMLFTSYNPITATSPIPKVDYNDFTYFFNIEGKKTARQVIEKQSQIQELAKFYGKSL